MQCVVRTPSGVRGNDDRLGSSRALQEDESRSNEFILARRCSSAKNVAVEFLERRVEQPFRRSFCFLARGLTLPQGDDRVEEPIDLGTPVRILLFVPFYVSVCLGNGVRRALSPAHQDEQSRDEEFLCARRHLPTGSMAVEFLEGCVEQAFRRSRCLLACGLTLPQGDDRVEEPIEVGTPVRVLLLVPFYVSVCLGNGIRRALAPARGRRWQEKSF